MYGLLHASGVATFGYALYYEFVHLHIPRHVVRTPGLKAMSKFPGKWKYLTVWDLVMQFAYHSYSLVNDYYGSSEIEPKKQTKMQKIRDVVFASIIFPTGAFVSITFWGIYSVDRELVFPKFMDAFYPSWLNHAVHTAPIIYLCVEIYNVPRNFPKRSTSIVGNIFFSTTYLGCLSMIVIFVCTFCAVIILGTFTVSIVLPRSITWIAYDSGVWAYPILEVLDNVSRTVFLGASAGLLLGLYFVGEKIQRWRWGDKSVASGTEDVPKTGSSEKAKTKVK